MSEIVKDESKKVIDGVMDDEKTNLNSKSSCAKIDGATSPNNAITTRKNIRLVVRKVKNCVSNNNDKRNERASSVPKISLLVV